MLAVGEVPRLLHLELMNHGVFCAPRGQLSVSTPMTEREIDAAVEAFSGALEVLRPYIAERTPHLVDQ
jgi:glutamate-1-semialdehyde aminotransferase